MSTTVDVHDGRIAEMKQDGFEAVLIWQGPAFQEDVNEDKSKIATTYSLYALSPKAPTISTATRFSLYNDATGERHDAIEKGAVDRLISKTELRGGFEYVFIPTESEYELAKKQGWFPLAGGRAYLTEMTAEPTATI